MLVVAFFAAPAMAQCCDDAKFEAVEGAMALGTLPENMNFDFVKQGNQEAVTFGFNGVNPVAKNAFNLEKDQIAGYLFDNGTVQKQISITDVDIEAMKQENHLYDTRVVNIEMITAGDQYAHAFGSGVADNLVNIKTTQSGCCAPGPSCC